MIYKLEALTQIVGWIGTFLIVFAYFFVSYGKIKGDSKYYQLLNLFGAIFVGVNVLYNKAWPAFTLQLIWGIISIAALIKIKRKKY